MSRSRRRYIVGVAAAVVLVLLGMGTAFGEPPLRSRTGQEVDIATLQDALRKNIKEEGEMQEKRRNDLRLAVRPYSAYLLHQQSILFVEEEERLSDLREERRRILRQMAGWQDAVGEPAASLREMAAGPVSHDGATYSGAPLMAFDHRAGSGPLSTSLVPSKWTTLFRFMVVSVLLAAYSLPIAALWHARRGRASIGNVWIYPLLTYRRQDGHRSWVAVTVRGR